MNGAWIAAPLAAGAVIATGLGPLFAPGEPAGADTMLHINDALCFANAARARDAGLWCDAGSLGYPLALTYQPLPSLFIALVHLVVGCSLLTAAKIAMALPLLLMPLTFACGARLAGLDRARAAAFGVACGCTLDVVNFGIGPRALLETGLLTQVWAHAVAPLAVGASLAFLATSRWGALAAAAIVALALCHPLIAIAALLVGAVVFLLRRPRPWRRVLVLGAVSTAALAFFLVSTAIGEAGGDLLVTPGSARKDLAVLLVKGALLDHGRPLPLLSLLAAVGCLFAIASAFVPALRADRSATLRVLAIGIVVTLAWSVLATDAAGLPAALRMTTRVAPLIQVIACLLAAEAAIELAARVRASPLAILITAVIATAFLAVPVAVAVRDLSANAFARRPEFRRAFSAVLAQARDLPPGNIALRGEMRSWRNLTLLESGHPMVLVSMGAAASSSSMAFRFTMADALADPWRYGVVGVLEMAPHTGDVTDPVGWRIRAIPSPSAVISGLTPASDAVREVSDVHIGPSTLRARVVATEGAMLLVRRSFHPWWTATVDGVVAEVSVQHPSLVGVKVPAASGGVVARDVVIAFVRPAWWWALVVASPMALGAFAIGCRVRRREAKTSR